MTNEPNAQASAGENPEANKLELIPSRQFASWLHDENITLAFSTYQAGKLFLIGSNPEPEKAGKEIYVFNRTLNRCMGICRAEDVLYVSSLYQIHRFRLAGGGGDMPMYIPQLNYITGDLDVHDMGVEADGRLVFAATLFNCVATVDPDYSFRPVWKPPFISALAPEDRCHLNGLSLRDGKARYVTAVSETDVVDGWREHRAGGGIVIDMKSNDIIASGLYMPHSPRWHNDSLYLNEAGTGSFGRLDGGGKFEEIAFCPGFLRGMGIYKNWAIVGISRPRRERAFQGMPLDERLEQAKVQPRCALMVIDINTGAIVHTMNIEGIVEEIFDIVVLPNTPRAGAIGFQTDEIRRVLSIDEADAKRFGA